MRKIDYISLGGGVQSSALIALEIKGKIKSKGGAIFADTGDEPAWVYSAIEKIKKKYKSKIHIVKSKHGSLSEFTLKSKFVSAPVFIEKINGKKSIDH